MAWDNSELRIPVDLKKTELRKQILKLPAAF
jgi:hypothetical protein